MNQRSRNGENNSKKKTYYKPTYTDIPSEGNKSKVPIIIVIVVVVILLLGCLRMLLSSIANMDSSHQLEESPIVGSENPKENEFTGMMADTWKEQSEDLSGHILYYTYDGETPEESYWEFEDSQKARLYMGDGSYYEADYIVLKDELGMLYTEFKYPDYGLTYEELERVTEANIKEDETCEGYIVVAFENMEMYDADGAYVESDEGSSTGMFYYGVSYLKDNHRLYDIVGANSAAYYQFVDLEVR